jgi:hypothetical protein
VGQFKKFALLCSIEGLDPDKNDSWRAFHADQKGLSWRARQTIEVSDDHALSWDEIETLTGGRSGVHNTPCPYCGADSQRSTRFRIERTLSRASWVCFYCGTKGTVDNPNDAPSEAEQAAERELQKEQRAEKRARALRL